MSGRSSSAELTHLEEVLRNLGGVDVALLGLGAINTELVRLISERELTSSLRVRLGYDLSREARESFASMTQGLGMNVKVVSQPSELWSGEHQIVVEAASLEGVRQYARRILSAGKWLVVLSIGALIGWDELEALEREGLSQRIFLTGGAIGPTVTHEFLKLLKPEKVHLRTEKPPRALALPDGTSYQVLLEGDVSEAIRRFPKNVNVSAYLLLNYSHVDYSLAVNPELERNEHNLYVESEAFSVRFSVSSAPTSENPATSLLTVYSLYYDLLLLGILIRSRELLLVR